MDFKALGVALSLLASGAQAYSNGNLPNCDALAHYGFVSNTL